MKRALVLPLALLSLALPAASGVSAAAGAGRATANGARLHGFRSCGELLGYVKQQALPLVQPWGLGASFAKGTVTTEVAVPSAATDGRTTAPAVPDFSTTNVQEEGVDEPDIVKSNGSYLFVLNQNTIRAVDVRGTRPRLAGSLELQSGFGSELLLYGNRLLVLSRGGTWVEPLPAVARLIAPIRPAESVLTEVDVSDPAAMKVVRTLTLDDSSYVSARLVGSTARIVASSSMPHTLDFEPPVGGAPRTDAEAMASNRAVVSSSRVSNWLPTYTLEKRGAQAGPARPLVQCRHVWRPASFSGLGMLTVLTIDLSKGLEPIDSDSILTDGRIVYASPGSLYVATERWADRPLPASPTDAPAGVTTAIHEFDISDPAKTEYRASGVVPGFLLSQWSLSEYGGALRVASTEAPAWWDGTLQQESQSFVSVLEPKDGKLVTVGRVGDLGRGERIYAVRFIGDTGYVVTFRQVDPLYTLDLSDPRHPAVLGELELEGYSAYLHPVGDNLLLGLGQDASAQGQLLGTQLSLFDVSNLRKPVRLFKTVVGPGSSEAEYDHHAFLYWPKTGLVAVPVQTYSPAPGVSETPFVGAIGFHVGRQRGIEELGRITHVSGEPGLGTPTGVPIRRSLVVGDELLTVSDLGVQANSLATFADLGWAGFPQPKPIPQPGVTTGSSAPVP
jgi:hypothetical protein